MILTIVKYPEPVLEQPGEPVTEFDVELRKLVSDMFEPPTPRRESAGRTAGWRLEAHHGSST